MSKLEVGDRVVTAAKLDVDGWAPAQQARRHPGAAGVIRTIHAAGIGPAIYVIDHDAIERSGTYHGDELTPLRKRADLEQPPDLEERLSKLEAQHSRSLDAMARELNGMETSLEHCQDRLRALEQRDSRRAADKLEAEAAVAAARGWCEEAHREIRQQIMQDLRQEGRPRAADALGAVPDLVAAAQAATVRTSELQALRALRRAAQELQRSWRDDGCPRVTDDTEADGLEDALDVLDELDAEEQPNPYAGVHDDSSLIPEAPAPSPSDARREIERLQEELEQAHADADLLTAQRDIAQRRNARAFETLREFDLRAGCNLINDAADDAAAQLRQTAEAVRDLTCAPETASLRDALEAARWKMEEYGCAESALRAELGGTAGLADLAKEAIREIRAGVACRQELAEALSEHRIPELVTRTWSELLERAQEAARRSGLLERERAALAAVLRQAIPDWQPDGKSMTEHVRQLAAASLIARTSQQKQAEVLSNLREIFGADETGFGLRQLAARAVRHAAPVLRLLEAYSAVEIDGCRGGLVSLTAPLPPHTVARGIADMLAEVAALAEGDGATDRHAAGCANVCCKGCATSTRSPR